MAKTSLPPGFRFHPTDVELIKYYLKRKVMGRKFRFEAIAELDIYKHAPWDLPAKSCLKSGDLKWYFFCPREKKYANGARMNRATNFGYWKTTGKDRPVIYNNETVGMIKTLVFHRGKPPRGDRTDWVMHEYRIEATDLVNSGVVQDAYVLCAVFQKEGPGPRNGAQYGAPFREEDWENDEDDYIDCMGVGSSGVHSIPVPHQVSAVGASSSCLSDASPSVCNVLPPIPENSSACLLDATPSVCNVPPPIPENNSACLSDAIPSVCNVPPAIPENGSACLSDAIPSVCNVLPPIPENNSVSSEVAPVPNGDDIDAMLAIFTEDGILEDDIFRGLPDLEDGIYRGLSDLDDFIQLRDLE